MFFFFFFFFFFVVVVVVVLLLLLLFLFFRKIGMLLQQLLLMCGILRIVSGDFDCLCSMNGHQTIYSSPSNDAEPLGYIYKTCKAIAGNITDTWVPVFHMHQVSWRVVKIMMSSCYIECICIFPMKHIYRNYKVYKWFVRSVKRCK